MDQPNQSCNKSQLSEDKFCIKHRFKPAQEVIKRFAFNFPVIILNVIIGYFLLRMSERSSLMLRSV